MKYMVDWQAISVGLAVMGLALSGLNIWVTLRIQLAFSRLETKTVEQRGKDKEELKKWAEDHFQPKWNAASQPDLRA